MKLISYSAGFLTFSNQLIDEATLPATLEMPTLVATTPLVDEQYATVRANGVVIVQTCAGLVTLRHKK